MSDTFPVTCDQLIIMVPYFRTNVDGSPLHVRWMCNQGLLLPLETGGVAESAGTWATSVVLEC